MRRSRASLFAGANAAGGKRASGAEDRNIFQSSRKIVLVRAVTAT
jgi:hypothetical protein